MDYEKAYKEAFEKAKIWQEHLYGVNDKDYADELNYIFPELAEFDDERIRKEIVRFIQMEVEDEMVGNKWIAWLERQKPTDKVEPKFKIDDFVVDNCGYVWKIKEILNQCYLLEGVEGGESCPTIECVNKTFHLWTINDAKDGDVLTNDNSIFIFQEEYIAEKPIAYCGLMNGLFIKGENACWSNKKCKPATKEQRDTLFAKMKEAGYEWDVDMKELKKIKQKHDWSEEDENFFNDIIEFFENEKNALDCSDWLKSLKQRIGE